MGFATHCAARASSSGEGEAEEGNRRLRSDSRRLSRSASSNEDISPLEKTAIKSRGGQRGIWRVREREREEERKVQRQRGGRRRRRREKGKWLAQLDSCQKTQPSGRHRGPESAGRTLQQPKDGQSSERASSTARSSPGIAPRVTAAIKGQAGRSGPSSRTTDSQPLAARSSLGIAPSVAAAVSDETCINYPLCLFQRPPPR